MSFTSFRFLMYAAVLLALYYTVPRRGQWVLLLGASYGFYLQSGAGNLLFILLTTVSTYGAARIIERIQAACDRRTAKERCRKWVWLCL